MSEKRSEGVRLFVCTSKLEHFAQKILEGFGISVCFEAIYADRLDREIRTKAHLLATLLRENKVDPASAWIIGDRKYDLEAAHFNGVRSIAVSYGYGSAEELAAGRSEAICTSPNEIFGAIFARL